MTRLRTFAWLLSVFLLLFGARLVLLHNYGSSTPFFDDWDMGVFVHRFAAGELGLIDWFTPAYQHQLLFSKIVNVGLFDLNNEQWDTLNILVFNSVLWCISAVFLLHFTTVAQRGQLSAPLLSVALVALWLLPISIVAATWSIVTHFYFMMLLMVLAYSGIGYPIFSVRWIIALVALLGCGFTIGAGVFAPIPLLIIFAWRFWAEPENRADLKVSLLALVLVLTIGLASTLLWGLAESSNEHYQVKSGTAFWDTLVKTVFWPLRDNWWSGVVLWLPSVLLVFFVLKRRVGMTPLVIFTIALAGYMMMQSIGIAIVRNDAHGINPAVRYYEFLLLSLLANFLAILLLQGRRPLFKPVWAGTLLLATWLLVVYQAVPDQYQIYKDVAQEELERRENQTRLARGYVGTGDIKQLFGHPYFHLAFPRSPEKLAKWLDEYENKNTLAAELQVPARLVEQNNSVFTLHAAVQPVLGIVGSRYEGETAMGSFNERFGAQNAKGEYESQVYSIDRPYLMIPTLGFLGFEDLSLKLVEVSTGRETPVIVREDSANVEYWRKNLVPAPDGAFRIVANDQSDKLWFAFAAPRELGVVSYYVRRLIEHRSTIWNLGVIGLIVLITVFVSARSEQRESI